MAESQGASYLRGFEFNMNTLCQRLEGCLRPVSDLVIDTSGHPQAAVVLIIRPHGDETEVLIIKRADHPRDPWSGHLALPGGRAEPGDEDLRAVAIRETKEEVGIDLDAGGCFLGGLEPMWPGNPRLPKIAITPLVAIAPEGTIAHPSLEVQEAFWMSLITLKQEGRSDTLRLDIQGKPHEWPAYPSPHGPIWGITERILTEFLRLIE
jgi:8-oxo-dGTP pyrophosphatase MutT (NUDIX family)